MKVAVVHDWCVTYGGAERVLERILDMYPEADLFSLIDKVPDGQREFMRGKQPQTTFFQKIPNIEKHYRKLLALMPHAVEQFDLSGYDLIISSHYSVAKGVITGPRQTHVCYCHSPMRYAWDMQHSALADAGLNRGLKSILARWQLHHLRQWDARCANNVDVFIANSSFVSDRIWRCYRRQSTVIPPPVDVASFALQSEKDDYYISVGRLVTYKKVDLLLEAFRQLPEKKLIVVGDGPELTALRAKAPSNVELLGRQPFAAMCELVARARALVFAAYEDFGIVPLEAQAAGTPVIAFGSGGSLETVVGYGSPQEHSGSSERGVRPPTGLFFYQQSVNSVRDAINRFEQLPAGTITPENCREHALAFNGERFDVEFRSRVEAALSDRRY